MNIEKFLAVSATEGKRQSEMYEALLARWGERDGNLIRGYAETLSMIFTTESLTESRLAQVSANKASICLTALFDAVWQELHKKPLDEEPRVLEEVSAIINAMNKSVAAGIAALS